MVACELARRARDVAYVRTASGYEVDFIARSFEGEEILIQVSADIGDSKTRERECRALAEASMEYPDASLLLITEFEEQTIDYGNIKIEIVPAWRWLCDLYDRVLPRPNAGGRENDAREEHKER